MLPDGNCVFREPSSLQDYAMPLPEWLSEGQWKRLVAEARRQGKKMLSLDRRTGGWLDRSQPHYNRYRLDVYYCAGCGRRMGVVDELCLECRPRLLDPSKLKGGDPPFCRTCGKKVKGCGKDVVWVQCFGCVMKSAGMVACGSVAIVPDGVDRTCAALRHPPERCLYVEEMILPLADTPSPKAEPELQQERLRARDAYLNLHGQPGGLDTRICPDCGRELAKHATRCPTCAENRSRKLARARKRRQRRNRGV